MKSKCAHCDKNVPAKSKAVQCSRCDKWIHIDCCGIDEHLYEQLKRSFSATISFHCDHCLPKLNAARRRAGLSPLTPKTDSTPELESSSEPSDDNEAVSEVSENHKPAKTYASVVASSHNINKRKERRPSDDISLGLQELLNKVNQLETAIKTNKPPFENTKPETGPPSRERCLIILNASESTKETAAERILDDQLLLKKMVSKLFDSGEDGINVLAAYRLGRKTEDDSKPRPLKLVLKNEDECRRVLRRTYRLKGEPYFVVRDLSPEDRIKMREAVKTLKERRMNGETNLHIVDFRVVQKRPRVVWKPILLKPDQNENTD